MAVWLRVVRTRRLLHESLGGLSSARNESRNALAEVAVGREATQAKFCGVDTDTSHDGVQDLSVPRVGDVRTRSDQARQIQSAFA